MTEANIRRIARTIVTPTRTPKEILDSISNVSCLNGDNLIHSFARRAAFSKSQIRTDTNIGSVTTTTRRRDECCCCCCGNDGGRCYCHCLRSATCRIGKGLESGMYIFIHHCLLQKNNRGNYRFHFSTRVNNINLT